MYVKPTHLGHVNSSTRPFVTHSPAPRPACYCILGVKLMVGEKRYLFRTEEKSWMMAKTHDFLEDSKGFLISSTVPSG